MASVTSLHSDNVGSHATTKAQEQPGPGAQTAGLGHDIMEALGHITKAREGDVLALSACCAAASFGRPDPKDARMYMFVV